VTAVLDVLIASAEECPECEAECQEIRGVVVCPNCDVTGWWQADD
jgi:uncharacterized Zn finger protein (UPF0148 family)